MKKQTSIRSSFRVFLRKNSKRTATLSTYFSLLELKLQQFGVCVWFGVLSPLLVVKNCKKNQNIKKQSLIIVVINKLMT